MKFSHSNTQELYPMEDPIWLAPDGSLLDCTLAEHFNPDLVNKNEPSIWRYAEVLPNIAIENRLSLGGGFTPLLPFAINDRPILFKHEYLFSTGSYKDRGAALLMSMAKQWGIKNVVQDSSGNAGCAIAAYAAAASIACSLFIQEQTSPSKIAQMKAYGATLKAINGSREDIANAAMEATKTSYYASHCWNPLFFQGTKTLAYEICEQLNWKAPDSVVLPAGNGTLLLGCYIGFSELVQFGIIKHLPKLIGVQSANCAPLATAFFSENNVEIFTQLPTIAEGIAIAKPVRGEQLLAAVKNTNGTFITVSEQEIENAWKNCVQKGLYIEPTSAATVAGVASYAALFPNEQIVSVFTGTGLKSTDSIAKLNKL